MLNSFWYRFDNGFHAAIRKATSNPNYPVVQHQTAMEKKSTTTNEGFVNNHLDDSIPIRSFKRLLLLRVKVNCGLVSQSTSFELASSPYFASIERFITNKGSGLSREFKWISFTKCAVYVYICT